MKDNEIVKKVKADEKLGNVILFGEKGEKQILEITGREKTIYSKAKLYINIDKENTPTIHNLQKITRKGLKEVVSCIHKKFMGTKKEELKALTGLKEWSSPESDLWIYYGENNANSIMEIYDHRFTNYSLEPVCIDNINVMTVEELKKHVDFYYENTFNQKPEEITKERYWENLEILPPARWENNVFYVSEAYVGYIHSMFCKLNNRYFEALRNVNKTSNTDFILECQMLIDEQEECETEKNAKNSN